MATRKADLSPEHFQWLVEGRSQNQASTLRLYTLIHENEKTLNGNVELHAASAELTGIAFSLWRAVFLSDTSGEFEDKTADIQRFLQSLISDNTVLYATDKNARSWSFHYYLDNAVSRLKGLASARLKLSREEEIMVPATSDKDQWLAAQAALDRALERFAQALSAPSRPTLL